jgi:hypothetical protein
MYDWNFPYTLGGKVRDCTEDLVAVVQLVFYQDFIVALSLGL